MPTPSSTPAPAPRTLQFVELPTRERLQDQVGVLFYVNVALEGASPERRCIVLPNASVDLVINLGGPIAVERNGDPTPNLPLAALHGPHSDPITLRRKGALCLIGARFRHGVAATFLNMPLKNLVNGLLNVESFWPDAQKELIEPVLSAGNLKAKFEALEKSLGRFLERGQRPDPMLRRAVKIMAQRQGDVEVTELARLLKVSRQTVKHKFDQNAGLSPKQFSKLRRFQHLLRMISSSESLNWPEVAKACGFYDQAHLIREFNSFTGFSPEKFLKTLRRGDDLYLFETSDLTHLHLADRFKLLAGLS